MFGRDKHSPPSKDKDHCGTVRPWHNADYAGVPTTVVRALIREDHCNNQSVAVLALGPYVCS